MPEKDRYFYARNDNDDDGRFEYATLITTTSKQSDARAYLVEDYFYSSEKIRKRFGEVMAIEKAESHRQRALEALRAKKIADAYLQATDIQDDAAHMERVLEVRQKAFPDWDKEKALRRRLLSMLPNANEDNINSQLEEMETKMAAAVDIILAYADGVISWDEVKELLAKQNIGQMFLEHIRRHHDVFGLDKNFAKDEEPPKWGKVPSDPRWGLLLRDDVIKPK